MSARLLWYVPIALAIIVGVAGSMAIFFTLRKVETLSIESDFAHLAVERSLTVAKAMDAFVHDLRATGALFDASEFVTRNEFRLFVTPLLRNQPGIRALEWIPRIPRTALQRYEETARKDGFDLRIRGMSEADDGARGADQDVYPVFYVEPYETNEAALGLDLNSDEIRREALERARDTAKPAATQPLVLVQDAEEVHSVLVFLPHYDRRPAPVDVAGRRKALVGFVLAVFRLTDLLEAALSTLDTGAISVAIVHEGVIMAEQPRIGTDEVPIRGNTATEPLRYETISMGGRAWKVRCIPANGFRTARRSPLPMTALVIGLFVTLLLTTHLYVVTRRAELRRELEISEHRYRTLVEHAPEAVIIFDAEDRRFVDANNNASVLLKRTLPELLETDLGSISAPVQPDGRDSLNAARQYIKRAVDGETPVFFWIHRDAEGNDIPCEVRLVRLPSQGRALVRGSITDVTERIRAEEKQVLMIRELDHRVKNNLATVVALTHLTAAVSGSVEELRASLVGRIEAIAQVHRTLASRKWEGVELSEILELTFAPYGGSRHSDRVALDGDSLTLSPDVSSGLCMAFHELATNASKYGALCRSGGHISVAWSLCDGALDLEWVESGGPPVTQPRRVGFGSRLLDGIIEHELGGSVQLEFLASGMRCHIHVPLGGLSASASAIF